MKSMLEQNDTVVILEDVLDEEKSTDRAQGCAEKTRYVFLVSSSHDHSAQQTNGATPISYSKFVTLCTELSPIHTWY
ncbi:MAG: hypothetical protein K6L81_01620 [Agarilytica sp.]